MATTDTAPLLDIQDLHAGVEGASILKGLSLTVRPGEVHAIMGPNGAGKSTLSHVLAGRDGYEVTSGTATLGGEDLFEWEADERAKEGLFLAFQYPVEIPGVTNKVFLKHAVNAVRKHRGEGALNAVGFLKQLKRTIAELHMSPEMADREVNAGFSGGEKKKNEILQMAMLDPRMCVLDETDSGLDIDALKVVADGVNALRSPERGFLVITHYQRLLDHIRPDVVHVLVDGRIVLSGGPELALELEEKGYDWVKAQAAA